MNFDEKVVDRIKKLEREVERLRVKESPGAWQSWTPTLTYLGGTSNPTYTGTFRYSQIGKIVMFQVRVSFTLGASNRSYTYISLPITAVTSSYSAVSASGNIVSTTYGTYAAFVDSGAGITIVHGTMTRDGNLFASGFYEAA